MADYPETLAERLANEGVKTCVFFSAIPEAGWQHAVYAAATVWTVRQVLAHFVSAEFAFACLFEDILAGGSGAPQDFDIDAFNQQEVTGLMEVEPLELLEQFRRLRQENVALVAKMKPADLLRRGRHPFLGNVELVEMVKLLYRHNQIHQRDVRRALAELYETNA